MNFHKFRQCCNCIGKRLLLQPEIKDEVLEKLMFFLSLEDADVQLYTLQAFGTVCLRHADVMMTSQFSRIYLYFLDSPLAPLILKRQVSLLVKAEKDVFSL